MLVVVLVQVLVILLVLLLLSPLVLSIESLLNHRHSELVSLKLYLYLDHIIAHKGHLGFLAERPLPGLSEFFLVNTRRSSFTTF